jgi:transposase
MCGYLLVSGGVHIVAYAKALEKLTGTPVGGLLPIPDVSNKKFPEAMALEAQGLHTIMWKWCPSDTYTQVGEIWNGPHPEDGMELEVRDEMPPGFPWPKMPDEPQICAPGEIDPEMFELLREEARLAAERHGGDPFATFLEEQGVQCAPVPVRIIEKGLASDRVVIDTVVSKYADHLPLFRQSAILLRETGIDLSRATLDGWVMRVGDLLWPITAAMGQELLSGSYIQADETTVGVQMHDGRGKNHQAYLWQYSRPGGPVVFDFRMGREREGPKEFLGNFEGRLQSDGYSVYDHLGGPKIVHAACWAHARREFFDAVKLNPTDQTSIRIVAQMDELFAIDAQARQEGLSPTARHVLRLEKAKPLLEQINAGIQAARAGALPQSALAKACNYTLTLWTRLGRFLEYPELELSNNLAENAMRPVALGRKNWIHVGSKEAGPRVAAIISIVETCRRLSLPIRDYLASVLPGLADFPSNRVAELTPSAWAARNSRGNQAKPATV